MGNLFSRCSQKKPGERVASKENKRLVEQHSSATCDLASNVEDVRMVDLESGLANVERYWEKKEHNWRWIDLKFRRLPSQLTLSWFRKKVELVHETGGKPNGGYDDVPNPFKVEEDYRFHTLHGGNSPEILVTHGPSNIRITRDDLECLRPGAWLNDEVINLYLELLKERERREPEKFLTCHFFNTFFFKKLISGRNGYDFRAVSRWTTREKLGYTLIECDKVFVPIHKDVHWCLVVINVKDETFQYLDSLGGLDTHVLEVLAIYFMEEAKDKGEKEVDTKFWRKESVDGLPLQRNDWDCGMFMLKYIDFYSRGWKLFFHQDHIDYFRETTAEEILRLRAE